MAQTEDERATKVARISHKSVAFIEQKRARMEKQLGRRVGIPEALDQIIKEYVRMRKNRLGA